MGFGYVDGQSVGNASFGHFSAQSLGEEGVGSAPVAAPSANPGPLIIEIDTRNTEAGSSNSDQFGLYLPAGSYNFEVDWGDGNTETITTSGTTTHTYSTEGIYEVTINTNDGTFAGGLNIGNSTSRDRLKYTDIKQWGTYCTYNTCSFWGCSNMDITATDTFVYVSANGVNDMFRDTAITKSPIMDLSGYTTTAQARWFRDCVNMTDLDASCVGNNAMTMFEYCRGCTALENFTGDWSTALANVNRLNSAFQFCSSIVTFPTNDFSGLTNSMRQTWDGCTSLTTFTGGNTLDCSLTTRIDLMLQDTAITSISLTTSSTCTLMYDVCNGCSSLTSFSMSDVSAITNATTAFSGVTLNTADWDQLLIDFDNTNSNTGVVLGGGSSLYTKAPSSAETARSNLLARVPAWVISDGGPTP